MQVLTFNFFLLSITGVWKPRQWGGIRAIFYYIYQAFVVIINLNFLLSNIMDLKLENVNLEAFADNLSLIFALSITQKKINCVIENRNSIMHIIDLLHRRPFKLRDHQEELIFSQFDKFARSVFTRYVLAHTGFLSIYSLGRMTLMDPPHTLPYNGWFPYNYTRTTKTYWATAVFQFYAVFSLGVIDLLLDLLLPCLMCYMCGHIHILRYRFQVMIEKLLIMSENNESYGKIVSAERKLMAEWVKYHIDIINLVKFTNEIFEGVIFVQYTVISLLLCTIAYFLSHTKSGTMMSFAGSFAFLAGMVIQILLPCFFADQLTVEFLDISTGIYNTKWYNLSNNIRRSVVIILRKSYQPVTITSIFFIILSLESFMKVIKVAYTIYNVLE
ncbi:odorant receptor 67c-like isoform X2 [Microplitis mediator]|uniref:odorant receptor 67c-like isoform X2 n=1 Tax=Microplitis mediator TaxID=375433 RepID=UPI002552A578|nr:odorant receptor 67c-like isoform X2 [Microplitis mediator]